MNNGNSFIMGIYINDFIMGISMGKCTHMLHGVQNWMILFGQMLVNIPAPWFAFGISYPFISMIDSIRSISISNFNI